jgi:hypothetical protein
MPRVCTICTHPRRQAIDKALVGGATMRELAAKYRVSPDAMERHNAAHLPKAMIKAAEVEEVRQALDVVQQLKAINGATLQILMDARATGDADTALKAIDRIHKQIELQAKLLGELSDAPQVDVVLMPEWLALRGAILAALAPYSEARATVATQILRLEEHPA